jgi:ATP-binding cassette, subfamily B, multidrug efflux pump
MIKSIWPYTKGYRFKSVMAALTIIGEVVVEVSIPYMMADIVNIGIANKDTAFIIQRGLIMIAMALGSLTFGSLSAWFASSSGAGFAKNLRAGLFEKVQGFSFANVDHFSTASLITRLTTDVNTIQNTYMMAVRTFIRAPFMLIAATVMAIKISPDLAVVFLFALPVLGVVIGVLMTKTFPRFRAMLNKFDAMNASVQENLTAIRVVKAFVRGDYEDERFTFSAKEVKDYQVKAEKLLVVAMPLSQYMVYICMIAVCYLGGVHIVNGTLQSGDLISFISYVTQVLSSVMMVAMMMVMLVMSKASMSRISEVLAEVPSINDDDAEDIAVKDGSIEFNDVSFSYNGDPANPNLEHINLKINSGETIGIIGGTGSAKSTLVQLIPRLYEVTSGSVKVGGRDVKDYKLNTLRSSVSMVLQKNVLFSGTIKDNLRWGDANASDAEIEEACRAAAADGFIKSFPDGYDTELGQGGVNVSGGQKQRLCIARALISKPKIIIMDDSTSAVDTATDASIRQALRTELNDTTTIIIAQRITSVMDADRIVIMNEGKIDDVGTHAELMQRSEIYREVYESQQKGVEE